MRGIRVSWCQDLLAQSGSQTWCWNLPFWQSGQNQKSKIRLTQITLSMQYKPQDSFSSQFPPWLMEGGLTVALITGLMLPDWLQHVGVESDDRVCIKHPLQHLPVHRLQQPRGGQPQHQSPPQDHPRPAGQPWGHNEGLQDGSAKGEQKMLRTILQAFKTLVFVSLGPKSELKWFPNFSQSSQEWTFLCDTFAKVYS